MIRRLHLVEDLCLTPGCAEYPCDGEETTSARRENHVCPACG